MCNSIQLIQCLILFLCLFGHCAYTGLQNPQCWDPDCPDEIENDYSGARDRIRDKFTTELKSFTKQEVYDQFMNVDDADEVSYTTFVIVDIRQPNY